MPFYKFLFISISSFYLQVEASGLDSSVEQRSNPSRNGPPRYVPTFSRFTPFLTPQSLPGPQFGRPSQASGPAFNQRRQQPESGEQRQAERAGILVDKREPGRDWSKERKPADPTSHSSEVEEGTGKRNGGNGNGSRSEDALNGLMNSTLNSSIAAEKQQQKEWEGMEKVPRFVNNSSSSRLSVLLRRPNVPYSPEFASRLSNGSANESNSTTNEELAKTGHGQPTNRPAGEERRGRSEPAEGVGEPTVAHGSQFGPPPRQLERSSSDDDGFPKPGSIDWSGEKTRGRNGGGGERGRDEDSVRKFGEKEEVAPKHHSSENEKDRKAEERQWNGGRDNGIRGDGRGDEHRLFRGNPPKADGTKGEAADRRGGKHAASAEERRPNRFSGEVADRPRGKDGSQSAEFNRQRQNGRNGPPAAGGGHREEVPPSTAGRGNKWGSGEERRPPSHFHLPTSVNGRPPQARRPPATSSESGSREYGRQRRPNSGERSSRSSEESRRPKPERSEGDGRRSGQPPPPPSAFRASSSGIPVPGHFLPQHLRRAFPPFPEPFNFREPTGPNGQKRGKRLVIAGEVRVRGEGRQKKKR